MSATVVLPLLLILMWGGIVLPFRRQLQALWREPVLRRPVLIVESDDWGPAPPSHARALERVRHCLAAHRDVDGNAAVMTIGAILACPDTAALRTPEQGADYRRRSLSEPEFEAVRAALQAGVRQGVFALQLHGMEHFWPEALMRALHTDAVVQKWVAIGDGSHTEALPAPLQSRWVDGASVPSRALAHEAIARAVEEETCGFERCFGQPATVAVPPTFVWTEQVERFWEKAGIRTLITPGRRYTCRDSAGLPGGVDRYYRNGERAGTGGLICLVRDIYFEPARGHTAEQAQMRVARHYARARPALLETHRCNFLDDERALTHAVNELDILLGTVRRRFPAVRFMASSRLAEALRVNDPDWVCSHGPVRINMWLRRAADIARLRKLAWFSGLALPALALEALTRGATRRALGEILTEVSE